MTSKPKSPATNSGTLNQPNMEHLHSVKNYLVAAAFTMSQADSRAWELVSDVP